MKNIIKMGSTFFLLILFVSSVSLAQRVYFCEGVNDDGSPINDASEFTISSSGGYLYVLTKLYSRCNTKEAIIDIFKVGNDSKESFVNTIYVDTETSWTWFWKKVTFYNSGKYNVYVYDEDEKLLASGTVRINFN
jgi:hypothetical protein